jgi:hypothetical protein
MQPECRKHLPVSNARLQVRLLCSSSPVNHERDHNAVADQSGTSGTPHQNGEDIPLISVCRSNNQRFLIYKQIFLANILGFGELHNFPGRTTDRPDALNFLGQLAL